MGRKTTTRIVALGVTSMLASLFVAALALAITAPESTRPLGPMMCCLMACAVGCAGIVAASVLVTGKFDF